MLTRLLNRATQGLRKANCYHLVSRWRIRGAVEDVYALVANVTEYPQWWGDVFLEVEEAADHKNAPQGPVAEVRTRGWLPYRIRFQAQLCGGLPLQQITIRTKGDFVGRGTWRFRQDGEYVSVSFDWKVRVSKPLIQRFSILLKPLFALNHRWSMATGQQRLQATLSTTTS